MGDITTDISTITLSVASNSYGHTLKLLKTSDGGSHNVIVSLGSVFSIISKFKLMLFYPSAIISLTQKVLKGITGHSLNLGGKCKTPIMDSDNLIINCDFLVSASDLSILRLNELIHLHLDVSFMTTSYKNGLKDLIAFR